MAFGKSNYNKGGDFHKNFSLQTPKGSETTDNRYRLLPAKGNLADDGIWKMYYGIHFGFKGRDRSDPTKLRTRTFKCIEEKDFRSGIIKVSCPECDRIAERKEKLKQLVAKYTAEKKTEDEIKLLTAPLVSWTKDHNVDRKWYINAMNEAGEFGVVKISHKAQKDLLSVIDDLINKKKIDPLDVDQGVWFNFRRTGQGIAVVDKVEIVKTEKTLDDGEVVEKIKVAPLTAEQVAKADKICPNLTDVVTVLSAEQVGMLVASSGDPEEVDAIFNAAQPHERSAPPVRTHTQGAKSSEPKLEKKAETSDSTVNGGLDDDEAAALAAHRAAKKAAAEKKAAEEAAAAKAAAEAVAAKAKPLTEEDEEAQLLAAHRAKKKAAADAAAAPAKPATPQVPDNIDPNDLGDEEYAEMFGAK